MEFTFKQELYRKLIHLSSIVYPISYFFVSKQLMSILLITLFLLCFIWDILRIKQINLFKFANIFLREKEINNKHLTGATWFLLSCSLVVVIFPQPVAILSILILIFCDTIAALIGKAFGKTKIPYIEKKSLEGFLAFIILGLIISYYFTNYFNIPYNIYNPLAVIISAIIELIAKKIKIDDNFGITISFALIFNLGF